VEAGTSLRRSKAAHHRPRPPERLGRRDGWKGRAVTVHLVDDTPPVGQRTTLRHLAGSSALAAIAASYAGVAIAPPLALATLPLLSVTLVALLGLRRP
jgi:hypothetical protein